MTELERAIEKLEEVYEKGLLELSDGTKADRCTVREALSILRLAAQGKVHDRFLLRGGH
ncbi:MAG: hypothetical protein ABH814_03385 [bacterium]